MHCATPKGTSRAEALSNTEQIKPITVAIVELYFSKASGSQLISTSQLKFCIFLKILRLVEGI